MVQIDDATYAELLARAQKGNELEAENLRLKEHKHAPKWDDPEIEIIRLQAENQRLREKLGLAVRRLFGP